MNQIEEVKNKTDIVSLVGEYLPLKKAGRHYRANCPFHEEKTPSFMVSPEMQIYKCFGCGASGDVLAFLMQRESMEFYEALKYLADRAGVKLTPRNPQEESLREILLRLNEVTKNYYKYMLHKHPSGKKALRYLLEERGLKMEALDKFEIGFAPNVSRPLVSTLTGKFKFSPKDLTASGTFFPKGRDLVDRFAGRVIFPLFDHRGKVVGFSGRLLPWEDKGTSGKYINSPETPLYHKSANLYNLNFAKEAIKDRKYVVLVEGELDAISSYYAGVPNVVAIKGTAITPEYAQILKRFTERLVFFLDSDAAGSNATKRGIVEAYKAGLEIEVANLQSYKDPDEAARKSPKSLLEAIDKAVSVWDYFIDTAFSRYNYTTGEGKRKLSQELIPIIASIPDKIQQAHYVELFAKKLGIPSASVYAQLEGATPFIQQTVAEGELEIPDMITNSKEHRLLTLALFFDLDFFSHKDNSQYFSTNAAKRLFAELSQADLKAKSLAVVRQQLPAELQELFSDLVLTDTSDSEAGFVQEITEVKKAILKDQLEAELKDLSLKIKAGEQEGKDVSELASTFSELSKKLREVEENWYSCIIWICSHINWIDDV